MEPVPVRITVNGVARRAEVEPRMLLVDFIRDVVGLTGTHVGCDSTNCGACTVHLDGRSVKSCTMFALQADGREVRTVEDLADGEELGPLQRSFHERHALQCGYCTPGMLMSATYLLERNPNPARDEIKRALSGNLCRCTGYRFIVEAVEDAAARLQTGEGSR
ncbi:MAG: 2Fe-2S iron-sulfur cluster binding domain-containing protein [Nitriliruptorales bacterium]|nr:2Fe-2S iron-sulfur cluster binding domain-containing protein [Nitriliruptorales bacterium]